MGRTPHAPRRSAFTLIELLVVITIIVILISILAPSLDKAFYQAGLTLCSSHLKAMANGAVSYAMNNKQYFPYRNAIEAKPVLGGTQTNGNNNLQNPVTYRYRRVNTLREGALDDRPTIRDYIPMKTMVDPLCGGIDLSADDPANTSFVYANYVLMFGMTYERWGSMRKMGNRMNITDKWLSIMACDLDVYNVTVPSNMKAVSSHPDKDGLMSMQARNNTGGFLDSMWVNVAVPRGPIDFNQSHWDGSVLRLNDVAFAQADDDSKPDWFSDGTWQADSSWASGDLEFFGEYSTGPGIKKSQDQLYVNPSGS